MLTNVPTDLLRTFVTVVDLGSFTRAAEALGRTQPAISLQIKRLEDLLRTKLINADGRQVRLTDAGMSLGPYARQMLRLNDDIVAYFTNDSLSGWIRVGLPTDFSNSYLLGAITRFAASHPEVRIEVESQLSSNLRTELAADRIDLMVGIVPTKDAPFLVNMASITPLWAVAETFVWPPRSELPLVRHPDPCEYAERMRLALRGARKSWKTVMVASDVAGIQAAIVAGLGASALTPATLTEGMRVGRPDEGFPPLAPLMIGLFYKHARLSKAGHGLAQWLMQQITLAAQGSPA
ncbi:MAG: LysR family transcriptional regulator [Rhodobacteraceae bacterium]|jgi:DNA-binding transcriptional LysR family regulator|nr:LysR family transcriptional regulator [Paracoccaceae bacterium]MCF8512809.1 LysR family transcriptional regulator [Paracoccaceae bacterium]MCF8517054.1 LysR family transcriptional regulator [Paracoccaceae bacterium]